MTTRHYRSKQGSAFPWAHCQAPDQPHYLCLPYLLEPPQQLPAKLPPRPTTQTSPIPAMALTSTEALTLTRRAQTRTTPTRTPNLLDNLRRRKHSRRTRRSPTLASSNNTIATARGTIISNTKLRGNNQRRQRRSPLRMRRSSIHKPSSSRRRRAQWQIQLRRARPPGAGRRPQRCRHIFVLRQRRSPQELRRQQGRVIITILDISKLLGHAETRSLLRFTSLLFIFFISFPPSTTLDVDRTGDCPFHFRFLSLIGFVT